MDLGKLVGSSSSNCLSSTSNQVSSLFQSNRTDSFQNALRYAGEKVYSSVSEDRGIIKQDTLQSKKDIFTGKSDSSVVRQKYQKVNETKDSRDADTKKISNDDNSKANKGDKKDEVKEKLKKIKELLADPQLEKDVKKQDELLKLMLQLQAMVDGSASSFGKELMTQIQDVLNSPVLQELSVQDSLMKDVVTELKGQVMIASNLQDVSTDEKDQENVEDDASKTVGETTDAADKTVNTASKDNSKQAVVTDISSDANKADASQNSSDGKSAAVKAAEETKTATVEKSVDDEDDMPVQQSTLAGNTTKELKNGKEKEVSQDNASEPKLSLRQEAKMRLEASNKDANYSGESAQQNGTNQSGKDTMANQNTTMGGNTFGKTMNQVNSILRNVTLQSSQAVDDNSTDGQNLVKEVIGKNVEFVESSSKGTSAKEAFISLNGGKVESSIKSEDVLQASGIANTRLDQQLNVSRNNVATRATNPSINYKDVLEQVTKGAKVMVSESVSEMTIKMNPENLGKLSLKLVTENGIITAKFVAESQQVKEVIESNFNELKQSFADQGLNLAHLDVSVNSGNRESAREQMYNSSKARKRFVNISDDRNIEGITGDDDYLENDSKVNYRYPESSVEYTV